MPKTLGHRLSHWSLALLAFSLISCGDSSNLSAPASQAAWNLSGQGFKGPIANATVCVVSGAVGSNVTTDAGLACTTSDGQGNYSLTVTPAQIAANPGPYSMRVTGGTYTDEATGQTVALTVPLFVYMGQNAASVNGTLDRQALLAANGTNQTDPGNGGDVLVVDDDGGGPFVGITTGTTTPLDCTVAANANNDLCLSAAKSGSFNANVLTTMQLNQVINSGTTVNDTNLKNAQTQINNAFGLPTNLSLSQSKPGNGDSVYNNALFSLAQIASDKGVEQVVNANPADPNFQTLFQQAQTQVPALPTRWVFASASYPNGTRTALLPTGEMMLPGVGTLRLQSVGSVTQVLTPAAGQVLRAWSGLTNTFTLCSSSNQLIGTLFAPTNAGVLRGEAGYSAPGNSVLNDQGADSVTLECALSSTTPPRTRVSSAGNSRITVAGAPVVWVGVFPNGRVAFTGGPVPSSSSVVATIPAATLPAASYLLWVGGSLNATNNYGNLYAPSTATSFAVTGNMSDTTSTVPVFRANADGRVLTNSNSPISGNAFAGGFVEPTSAWATLLCERNTQGRLFGSSAMLRVNPAQLSTPVLAGQVFGRNWRAVQQCALTGSPNGPSSFNYTSAQGWSNSFAGNISASQMGALLLPSSTGVAASADTVNRTDTLFYSAFIASGTGVTAQLVMVERRITPDGQTRDIRLFYTVN